MVDENTTATQVEQIAPIKRKRGRPPGSKNKPKPVVTEQQPKEEIAKVEA